MAEIAAVRGTNGLRFVSTFSGCGGSCLGFEMAGWLPLYACEFIPEARTTYLANHPGVFVDGRDIRQVTPEDIMTKAGIVQGELDVLEGSPPCSSFSTNGIGADGWQTVRKYSDSEQRTDDLFFEFIRLLRGLMPRAFVAENVPGLAQGKARGYFKQIIEDLSESGYNVEVQQLDAQWLGVPQARKRLIFIGTRKDLPIAPAFPAPLPYRYSVNDAIADMVDGRIVYIAHRARYGPSEADKMVIAHCRVFDPDLPTKTVLATFQSGSTPRLAIVPHDDTVTPTFERLRRERVVQSEKLRRRPHVAPLRDQTIPELRRLCGFPDDFVLTGEVSQQWERLGRAVPPVMMSHVAAAMAKVLR